jgi:hypothetical protein
VGLHFGDSKSRVAASKDGEPLHLKRDVFTNLIGFLRFQMPLERLPKKTDVLCAEQAVKFLQQVNLKKPIHSGLVDDAGLPQLVTLFAPPSIPPAPKALGVASIPAMADGDPRLTGLRGRSISIIAPEPTWRAKACAWSLTSGSGRSTRRCPGQRCRRADHGHPPRPRRIPEAEDRSAGDRRQQHRRQIFKNALVHSPALFLPRRMARESRSKPRWRFPVAQGSEGWTSSPLPT